MSIRQLRSRRTQFRIRVRALVFERFDEFVEEDGKERAADGTDPVDPLGGVEGVDGDGGAEGAGGVEGATGPEDAWVEGGVDVNFGSVVKDGGNWGRGKKGMEVSWSWEPGENVPTSSAMKRLSPIPTGAMKLPWCFSAASMNIVKTSCAVRISSIITPCAIVVPPPSSVETARSPWNRALTIYAATMPATVWMMKRRRPRTIEMAPMSTMPTVTWSTLAFIRYAGIHVLWRRSQRD